MLLSAGGANKSYVDDNLHLAASGVITASADVTIGAVDQVVQVDAVAGGIDHDALLNFAAAEHIDWASTSTNS